MDTLGNGSPERPKVKVTYANRRKRRSTFNNNDGNDKVADASEGSESEGGASTSAPISKGPSDARATHHRRVDSLDLPGPAPRTKSKPSSSKDSISKRIPPSHNHTPSTDLTALSTSPTSPGRADRSLSTVASKLVLANRAKHRFQTPESDLGAPPPSDASEKARVVRTTEAERLAFFQNHPDVAEVEPHRVLCKACEKWLKLHSTQKYAMSAWKAHKLLCSPGKSRKRTQRPKDKASDAEDDDASSVAPSVSASEVSMSASSITGTNARLKLEERKQALEQDEFAGEVRESEVLCEPCQKWIKLGSTTKYSLGNWLKHTERVHGRRPDAPSSRVQEAERKLQLVNDAQAKEFSPNRVICKVCDTSVALSEKIAYDVRNWEEHKITCVPPADVKLASTSLHVTASPQARPPPSTASTDATVVDPPVRNPSPQPSAGVKRAREEEEGGGGEGGRAVRQRTESYVRADEKPPGPWGWFWLPWQTFKRGFAEGLWSSSGPSS